MRHLYVREPIYLFYLYVSSPSMVSFLRTDMECVGYRIHCCLFSSPFPLLYIAAPSFPWSIL